MRIHHEALSDVNRYIEKYRQIKLEDRSPQFDAVIGTIKRYKAIDRNTQILEIGTGTGWFPILCKKHGLSCKAIEISPHLVEFAEQFGRRYGVEPEIELGNIEETGIGTSGYDVIVATSTFEHVQCWRKGIERVFEALKPGGLFYFYSTNKFSLRSGEYDFPFYGWLPDSWRYRLRVSRQGEDIMKLGIDFNQFTYTQLRHFFKKVGFSSVLDWLDIRIPCNLNSPIAWRRFSFRAVARFRFLKHLVLLFAPGTFFICIK